MKKWIKENMKKAVIILVVVLMLATTVTGLIINLNKQQSTQNKPTTQQSVPDIGTKLSQAKANQLLSQKYSEIQGLSEQTKKEVEVLQKQLEDSLKSTDYKVIETAISALEKYLPKIEEEHKQFVIKQQEEQVKKEQEEKAKAEAEKQTAQASSSESSSASQSSSSTSSSATSKQAEQPKPAPQPEKPKEKPVPKPGQLGDTGMLFEYDKYGGESGAFKAANLWADKEIDNKDDSITGWVVTSVTYTDGKEHGATVWWKIHGQ